MNERRQSNKAVSSKRGSLVKKVIWHDHLKEVFISSTAPSIFVPRSACVSKGNRVVVDGSDAWVKCKNGVARIRPVYVAREHLSLGNLELELVTKEITEPEELAAYQALTQYHYRGHVLRRETCHLSFANSAACLVDKFALDRESRKSTSRQRFFQVISTNKVSGHRHPAQASSLVHFRG